LFAFDVPTFFVPMLFESEYEVIKRIKISPKECSDGFAGHKKKFKQIKILPQSYQIPPNLIC
jgi:hypothetical protein